MMHARPTRPDQRKLLPIKLWQYTRPFGGIHKYPPYIYYHRLLILPYASGVSIPAEKLQYIYTHTHNTNIWLGVS